MIPLPFKRPVFISYSRKDSWLAKSTSQLLGIARGWVFVDSASIEPGKDWRKSIARAVRRSKLVLVLWCEHSAESEYVRWEYETALAKGKTVIPVFLDDTPRPDSLNRFQGLDFRRLGGHDGRLSDKGQMNLIHFEAHPERLRPEPVSTGPVWHDPIHRRRLNGQIRIARRMLGVGGAIALLGLLATVALDVGSSDTATPNWPVWVLGAGAAGFLLGGILHVLALIGWRQARRAEDTIQRQTGALMVDAPSSPSLSMPDIDAIDAALRLAVEGRLGIPSSRATR